MDCDTVVPMMLAHNAMVPTGLPTDAQATAMNDNNPVTICPQEWIAMVVRSTLMVATCMTDHYDG